MSAYPYAYVQRLADLLDEAAGADVRREILANAESLTAKTNKARRAEILKTVMARMEARLEPETAIQVRAACCCRPVRFLREAQQLLAQASDIPAFLQAVEKKRFMGSPLKLDGDRIIGEFGFRACVCSKVNGASQHDLPMLWCECCRGHLIWMYESLFRRPLRIELIESVITGGEECRYIVHLG